MTKLNSLSVSVRALSIGVSAGALALTAPVFAHEEATASAPDATVATEAAVGTPALWKVADEDTTIYLFGTVHALPEDVQWYNGPIAAALAESGSLVTEIPASAMEDTAAMQQIIGAKAVYTDGTTLREVLNEEDRATYEAALAGLGVPVAAFDTLEPWFAGMTLAMLPLMKSGWTPESGVESVIEGKAGPGVTRGALETVDFQIGVLDGLPQESQVNFLITTAEMVDEIVPMMDMMVAEWLAGDADGLAELMNKGLTDPVLAEALLYSRNRNWADWIDTRLDEPGTVFVAVGAGHLAGDKSVQDYLAEREIATVRVQ